MSDYNAVSWPLSLQVTHSVWSFLVAKYVERLLGSGDEPSVAATPDSFSYTFAVTLLDGHGGTVVTRLIPFGT